MMEETYMCVKDLVETNECKSVKSQIHEVV